MFFSLFAGLIMAFAFQLLLTNLGVAVGLSAAGWAIAAKGEPNEDQPIVEEQPAADQPSVKLPVSHLLGIGVTLSLASVLFPTAYLATEFSKISQPGLGLIFGLMLWATYLLLLTWISSVTVSSIVGSVFGAAANGVRRLFSAVGQAVSPDKGSDKNADRTADAEVASKVDRLAIVAAELSQAMASQQQLPELLPRMLAQEREKLLAEICDRTNLAPDQAETLLNDLQPTQSDIQSGTQTAARAATEVMAEVSSGPREMLAQIMPSLANSLPDSLPNSLSDWRQLMRSALNQLDVSDWDLEKLWQQFQDLTEGGETKPFSVIDLDVEDYLLETPRWSLQSEKLSETVKKEFFERLYDPEAAPAQVENQLASLGREDFVNWLQQRDDLSAETIQKVADQLASVHSEVLKKAHEAAIASTENRWQQQLKTQLNKLSLDSLSADNLSSWLQDFVEHTPLSSSQIEYLLNRLDSSTLINLFERQATLSSGQRDSLLQGLEKSRDFVLNQFEKQRTAAAETLSEVQTKLIAYFRYTGLDKLTAESVEHKLRSQLEETALLTSSGHLRADLVDSAPDFDEIAQALERRRGITDEQLAELTSALKAAWQSYQRPDDEPFYSALSGYFRSIDWPDTGIDIGLEEIKPQAIAQIKSIIDSLPNVPQKIDDSRLLASISLPPATQSELSSWLQQSRHELLGVPRRWATRAVQVSQDWSEQLMTQVKSYLQHQKKTDLSSTQVLQDLSQITKAAARAVPHAASALPELSEAFWQQALASRSDLDLGEGEAIAGRLTSAWQTVTQSVGNWEGELQSATQSLMQFVSDDVVETTRQQFIDLLESAQSKVQTQTETVKRELEQQAEQVRHQAAIAAWWLFISLLTSGAASAGAGWLAVKYPII